MNHAPVLQRSHPPAPGAERAPFSIPELWERARVLFARLAEKAGAPAQLRARPRLGREHRREILDWLHPVESLVRTLVVSKAITFLLMTPQGRALMRPPPKTSASLRHKPPGTTRIVSIPHPGWHTIARSYRPEPPPPSPPPPSPRCDPAAPTRASFRVVLTQEIARLSPPRKPLRSVKGLVSFLGDDRPRLARAQNHPAETQSVSEPAEAPTRRTSSAISLARRIEALSRTIEKPEPLIRRLARAIAASPDMLLAITAPRSGELDRWRHGYPEFEDGRTHFRRARAALLRPPDSG